MRLWDAIGKTKEGDTPCPIYVVAGLGTGLARPPARLCRLAAPRVQAVYGMAAAVCMYCFSSSTFLCCVWMWCSALRSSELSSGNGRCGRLQVCMHANGLQPPSWLQMPVAYWRIRFLMSSFWSIEHKQMTLSQKIRIWAYTCHHMQKSSDHRYIQKAHAGSAVVL